MKTIYLIFLLAIPTGLSAQQASPPILTYWESVNLSPYIDFCETDSVLVSFGNSNNFGLLFSWYDSTLTVTTQTSPVAPNPFRVIEMVSNSSNSRYAIAGNIQTQMQNTIGVMFLNKWSAIDTVTLVPQAGNGSFLTDIITSPEGGFWVSGSIGIPPGAIKATLLAKFDSLGNFLFQKQYLLSHSSYANGIRRYGANNQLAIAGFALQASSENQGGFLLLTDALGDSLTTTFFGSQYAKGLRVFEDKMGDLLVLGDDLKPEYVPNQVKKYLTLRKFDGAANQIWEKEYEYLLDDSISVEGFQFVDACQSNDGGVVVLADISFSALIGYQPYVIKFDTKGAVEWVTLPDLPATGDIQGTSITQLEQGGLLITGTVSDSQSFYSFISLLESDGSSSTGTALVDNPLSVTLSPNPSSQSLFVEWEQRLPGSIQIEIFSLTGQRVINDKKIVSQGQNSLHLNIKSLASGVYTLKVSTEEHSSTQKFIKE